MGEFLIVVLLLAPLAKRLFPRLQTGRAIYHLKMIFVAALVGVVLGGIIVSIVWWQSRISK